MSRVVLVAMQDPYFSWTKLQLVTDALLVAIHGSVGLFLVFGSVPISKFFANTAEPGSVPPHQPTIGMAITIVAAFAGILALLGEALH